MITLIMDCVLILFRKKLEQPRMDTEKEFIVTSWAESLKTMGEGNFYANIVNYKKDLINAEMVDMMAAYINYA